MATCSVVTPQIYPEDLVKEFMYGSLASPKEQIEAISQTFKAAADATDESRRNTTQYIEELKAQIVDLSKGNQAIRSLFGEIFREKMAHIYELEHDLSLMKADRDKLMHILYETEKKSLTRTQKLIHVAVNLPSGRHVITS